MRHLLVPRERYSEEILLDHFALDPHVSTSTHWAISCVHTFSPAATDIQIKNLENHFGQNFPQELQVLLSITDGAELFRVEYKGSALGNYWVARYRLLSSSELMRVNAEILDTFQSDNENYPEFKAVNSLNYLAFCDVGDGNYLAINTTEEVKPCVFFLDHEYAYYPYGIEFTHDAYSYVADSIDDWLELLVKTGGWDAMGGKFIPL